MPQSTAPDPPASGEPRPGEQAVLDEPEPEPEPSPQPVDRDQYDVIVVGLGVMGLATCWQLARRGKRVLGLEQFDLLHSNGSSHGSSRVIRRAYFEHPDYVALLDRAYEGWKHLEDDCGEALVNFCGTVTIGPRDGMLIPGVTRADLEHEIGCETLSMSALAERFPALTSTLAADDNWLALYEPHSGYIHSERARDAFVRAAMARGATLLGATHVREWTEVSDGVVVETDEATYKADQVVLTTGGWTRPMLEGLGVPLTLVRKLVFWYLAGDEQMIRPEKLPCFIVESPRGFFYGVPDNEDTAENGLKIARHDEDAMIREIALLDSAEEMRLERWAEEQEGIEREQIEEFARSFLSKALISEDVPELIPSDTTVCMYSYSPDGHFIIDRHPGHPRVSFAAGFSGHGFKFAPEIGAILAELATGGDMPADAGFLRLGRFDTKHNSGGSG